MRLARLWPLALSSSACSGDGGAEAPLFADITAASGIDFRMVNGAGGAHFVLETMAGGLAWIDHDGDGDCDLYLVNGHSRPAEAGRPGPEGDRLFRNDGRGRFSDVTEAAKVGDRRYGFGAAVGDYDRDGASDLLVTNYGRNTLYRNQGDGTFSDVTEAAGLVEEGFNMSAVWFDLDRDGDLDLYIARYLRYRPGASRRCFEEGLPIYCSPKLFPGEPDLLYRNLGGGRFEEIARRAGVDRAGADEGKGLGVVACDFDRDGWTDLYVANDTTPNFLWRNRGDGTFADIAQEAGVALSSDGRMLAGMGIDLADLNGDGLADIHVTNFARELNSLYLSRTAGLWEESSRRAGLGATYLALGFGTLFLDADLDGDLDIATANGHVDDQVDTTHPESGSPYRQPPALFQNRGDGSFEESAARGGPAFARAVVGRGLARSDFDGDGDVDLALMTLDRSLVLLRNENPHGHRSVTIRLVGSRSPRDGYGARIVAEAGGRRQLFEYQSAGSYLSASDPRVVVGLGKRAQIDRLRIDWPSGQSQELRDVKAGERLVVREPE